MVTLCQGKTLNKTRTILFMSKCSTSIAEASQRDSNFWKELLWFELFLWFCIVPQCFQHPVQVSPKQRQQCFTGTIPPPPSRCNKHFPCGLSPWWTQSNKQYSTAFFFLYWKPESLLEEQTTWLLIVACLSAPLNCPQGLNTGERRQWRLHGSPLVKLVHTLRNKAETCRVEKLLLCVIKMGHFMDDPLYYMKHMREKGREPWLWHRVTPLYQFNNYWPI